MRRIRFAPSVSPLESRRMLAASPIVGDPFGVPDPQPPMELAPADPSLSIGIDPPLFYPSSTVTDVVFPPPPVVPVAPPLAAPGPGPAASPFVVGPPPRVGAWKYLSDGFDTVYESVYGDPNPGAPSAPRDPFGWESGTGGPADY